MAVRPVRNDVHGAVAPTAQTRTGVLRSSSVPSPTWPSLLSPQAWATPATMARECSCPAAMAVTPVRNDVHGAVAPTAQTGTGTALSVPVLSPLPSSPESLSPQVCATPSTMARECFCPAAIALTPVRNDVHGAVAPTAQTRTGTALLVPVLSPLPSWASRLLPQVCATPPLIAREYHSPAAMAVTPDSNEAHGAVAPTAHTGT